MDSTALLTEGPARLGLVAAFWWEVRPMLKKQREVRRLGRRLYALTLHNAPVVLAISGAGPENACRAAQELVRQFPLRGLVSVGFAGGLSESLQPGELVLADSVIEEKSHERFICDEMLLPIASGQRGGLLSVSDVLHSPDQKRRLGTRWGALAADMESAGVARAARDAELPFGALKSITDSSGESIAIDFQRCRSDDGGLSSWKIVREGLASPQSLLDLWRLAGNSRRAAGTLALALGSA